MKCLINLFEKEQLDYLKSEHGQYSCESAEISSLWNTQKLGFHMQSLSSKSFSCPYHLHHSEEEVFLAIKGFAMVRQDDQFFEIKEGDLIIFKTGVAHQFYNHTNLPFLFLAHSNKEPEEICEFPDSNKKWSRKQKKLFQHGKELENYWKDEENPKKFWPKEIIDL